MSTIISSLLSANAAAGSAVTLTIPAPPAGQRIRLNTIEIVAYSTAARTGTATPVIVTTTNMNGLTFWFSTAAAIGTLERVVFQPKEPFDGPTQATSMTIVCPATTSVMWRLNVSYHSEEF